MIPHIGLINRFIAWLIWHYEGYKSVEDAKFYILENPSLTHVSSLMSDYWYVRRYIEYGGETDKK